MFSAYAGFNVAYALIFIPGTGVLAAYTDTATGKPLPELDQALALLVWAWFILSIIFTVAATRASWSLLLTLVFFDLESMLLAVGYTVGNDRILLASRGSASWLLSVLVSPRFLFVRIIATNRTSQIGPAQQGFGVAELL